MAQQAAALPSIVIACIGTSTDHPDIDDLNLDETMGTRNFAGVTTQELLDALEAAIDRLRTRNKELAADLRNGKSGIVKPETRHDVHWTFPGEESSSRRSDNLRRHMEKAGLTVTELAALLGTRVACLQGWLSGAERVPARVQSFLSVQDLLTPAAARNAAKGRGRQTEQRNSATRHPFSRIEEL